MKNKKLQALVESVVTTTNTEIVEEGKAKVKAWSKILADNIVNHRGLIKFLEKAIREELDDDALNELENSQVDNLIKEALKQLPSFYMKPVCKKLNVK